MAHTHTKHVEPIWSMLQQMMSVGDPRNRQTFDDYSNHLWS